MNWNSVDDKIYYTPEGDYWPRLQMPKEDWEKAMLKLMSPELVYVYKLCKKHLQPPLDNPDDPYLVDRFILQDLDYVRRVCAYLQAKNETIKITAKTLYDGRQWAKCMWSQAKLIKFAKPNSWDDIKGRASLLFGKWSTYTQENDPNIQIDKYLDRHGFQNIHDFAKAQSQMESSLKYTLNTSLSLMAKPQFVNIRKWNQIDWQPKQRGKVFICPAVYCVILQLPLVCNKRSNLFEPDSYTPKTGCCLLTTPDMIQPMYTEKEYEDVLLNNKDSGVTCSVINGMYKLHKQIVK